jgi:ABC transporter DrrB family efflux protein
MDASGTLRSLPVTAAPKASRHGRLYWAIADSLVIAKRDLIRTRRAPDRLLDVTLQPVLFVLLFRYVFGGAINTGSTSYVNFLVPGILVQLLIFGGLGTGAGLAEDLKLGVVDRFRSLPMARSAVLVGRTLADLAKSVLGAAVVLGVGFAIGYHPEANFPQWVAALSLALLLSFTISWFGAIIALLVKSVEGVYAAGFTIIFPLTFASSVFVPTETMPGWLRAFTDHQPVTVTVNAVRAFLLGEPAGSDAWAALLWCFGLLAVLIPIAVWRYQRRAAS